MWVEEEKEGEGDGEKGEMERDGEAESREDGPCNGGVIFQIAATRLRRPSSPRALSSSLPLSLTFEW